MTPVIHIQPSEGWGYFASNQVRLSEELVEIASNSGSNTSVYMTEEDGKPYLYVYRDDKKIFQSECRTQYETERNLRVIYAQYLSPMQVVTTGTVVDDGISDDPDIPPCEDLDAMTEIEWQEYCDEREDVISAAVCSLIEILADDEIDALNCDIYDITNKIVEYLAVKCGLCIRRPMEVVDDDTGLVVRTEYPYEEFEFGEDELNAK